MANRVSNIKKEFDRLEKERAHRVHRLLEIARLATSLSEQYLANASWPKSRGKFPHPHEFVTGMGVPRGHAIHREWRNLWELTHPKVT